jgi:uncharacterized membrane protein (DUF4010 family)
VTDLEIAVRLAVAALAGLAVGIEREWSGHASGPGARFAGVRTFFLLGLLGGLAGVLGAEIRFEITLTILLTAGALVVAAYVAAARRAPEAVDGTTETAALVVLALGTAAGLGWLQIASGAAAVMVLALGEKDVIRRFVSRIDDTEMRAALHFAVLALVILPLLPVGPVEALAGIRPRALWIVVLLFSGLSFVGFVARRAIGEARGYLVAGALGGVVSSTAVTLNFARQSRKAPADSTALALGAIAASTILVPRILILTLILNPRLLPAAALGLAPVLAVGLVIVGFGLRRVGAGAAREAPPDRNPLQLWSAIRLAVAFQAVLLLLDLVVGRFGDRGAYIGAGLLGLTDMDALTFAMNQLAGDPAAIATASVALAIGVASNSLLKAGVAFAAGSSGYRRVLTPVILLFAVLCGGGAWLTWSVFGP